MGQGGLDDMPLLIRKWEKDTMRLIVQYKERSSASVESAAITVCMFVDQDMMIPLYNAQWD